MSVSDTFSYEASVSCSWNINATCCVYRCLNRRLEVLEDRTDNLNQLVVDLGKSIEANTHAVQEQTATVERSFRELARGIQLIRDKQVSSCIRD